MFVRLVSASFLRHRRRKLVALTAITLGIALATAMVSVATQVGDRMGDELRGYGANIVIYPQEDTLDVEIGGVTLKPASDGAFLDESELPKIKQVFWANNIRGYTPMLPAQARIAGQPVEIVGTYFAKPVELRSGIVITGVTKTHPWWKIEGAWAADDSSDILVGRALAARLKVTTGTTVNLNGRKNRVAGILDSGGAEDNAVVAPLALVQRIIGRPGAVRRVYVSALIKPEDDFARRDPKTMSGEVLERWACSPYANSIAYQIAEVIPGARAEQIRAVAQNEGLLLSRISGLLLLITAAAFVAATLAVAAAMATSVFERRAEIGLMKALGAGNGTILAVFLAEATVLAVLGGSLGFLTGITAASQISATVFGTGIAPNPALWPVALLASLLITLLAAVPSLRQAVRVQSAVVLRGAAA